MNEKIYLGFAGKENLRLGESLIFVKRSYDIISNQNECINTDFLYKYMSNVYTMYNIQNINQLMSIVTLSTKVMICGFSTSEYNEVRKMLNKEDYDRNLVYLSTFKFFNEKVWPRIIESYMKELPYKNNSFILVITMPFSLIQNLVSKETLDMSIASFISDMGKWLDFQLIGKFERIEYQGDKLVLKIKVMA